VRNTLLEHTILKVLGNTPRAILLSTLAAEVDIRIDHHELTYNDLKDTLQRLSFLGLVTQTKDVLDYSRWSITDKGQAALKELGL